VLQIPASAVVAQPQTSPPLPQKDKELRPAAAALSTNCSPIVAKNSPAGAEVKSSVGQARAATPRLERGKQANDRSNGQSGMNGISSSATALSSGVDAQNPWPGLAPFTEELKRFFQGRAEETDELLRRVGRKDLTVLFGQSGLGKSSLLQAGLFPRLRAEGYLPVPIRLDHAAPAPPLPDQVKAAVTRAIVGAGGRVEYTDAKASDTLWEHFHRRGLRLRTPKGEPVSLVLVLDQFEELFAIGQASEETRARAARFLTELADLIENRVPKALEAQLEESPTLARQFVLDDRGYRALICLREDYLPHLESLRSSMPSIAENRMRLTRMNGLRALEAVLEPGRELIAPEVGRQIVRFVAGGEQRRQRERDPAMEESTEEALAKMEIEPSLLSLVCRELNNRRLALGLPRITADLLAGNRERILQDYYERCFVDQLPAVRVFVEDELVTDSGLRENIALERARKTLTLRGAPAAAIDELVKRRLLHIEERLDIQRVELTHDVLTAVVKKSRDQRQQQEATQRAEQQAREAREKARRQRRRLRWIVAGMAVALLVVGSFGVASYRLYRVSEERLREVEEQKREVERQKERVEESQKLAVQRFKEKRQAMDNMLAQFSDKRLSGMPGTQQVRKVLFEHGVELYEGMFRDNLNDPAIQLSLTERYAELGRLQSEIGTIEEALEPLKKGEKLLRRLVEKEPQNADYRFRLAVILYQIGYCCWEHQKTEPGIPALREAIQILAPLAESEPRNFDRALQLALVRTRLAALMTTWTKEREQLYQTGYDSLKQLVAERPKDARALIGLVRVGINRGLRAVNTQNYKEAETVLQEARQLSQQCLAIDPNDPIVYTNLKITQLGLSQVYRETNRIAQGIKIMTEVVEDLEKLAADNPAVLYYQRSLVWAHDDLRKLYQHSGDYEKAISSLQEIIRISEALAQRDPQHPQHHIDIIDAYQGIADIYRNRNQKAEAAAILDKAIKQAEAMMKQHPAADDLLRGLIYAHLIRGELSMEVQQYEKAAAAYQGGVDLFTRYRSSIKSLGEYTKSNYFQCCRGLVLIAKEKKDTDRAIALATKLILPIKIETFDLGDHKQGLLGEWIILSGLYEDTGNVEESLRLRVLAVDESKKMLGGDPKSNWYAYQQVFGAHQHLARLYRKLGNERREFEAIRNYLKETEPYVRERDHSSLLAMTSDFTPQNLNKLREAFDKYSSGGGMKRFTIPTDFSGIKYPFHVYVTDSWQFLEDQFTWVEKVRGGKVPKEVVDSFRRLYKIAKDNKVSFMDLCVYALGTAAAESTGKEDNANPIVRLDAKSDGKMPHADDGVKTSQELDAARKEIQAGKGSPLARKRLALKYARLAEDDIAASKYDRAPVYIDGLRDLINLDSFGRLRDPRDGDVYAHLQFLDGALLACRGELLKGYSRILDSIQSEPEDVSPEFAIPSGKREFALGWISLKLNRPVESAMWYRKAMELGHRFAAGRLYLVCQKHPQSTRVLPDDLRKLLAAAPDAATKTETAAAVFARLVAENTKARIVQAPDSAEQFRLSGEQYLSQNKNEQALEAFRKERDLRSQQIERARAEHARSIYHVAHATLELGRTAEALPLLRQAQGMDNEEATFALAELYEQGKGVPKDASKAASLRSNFTFRKGRRLSDQGKYAEALVEFQRSEKDEPSLGGAQRIGWCLQKLGRNEEAITAFKSSVTRATRFNNSYWVVLDLLETALSANKPDEVFTALELLEKRKWTPEQTPNPYTIERELAGLRAIALHMAEKDASEAEKKLQEIAARPNLASVRNRTIKLDEWLKSAKPSEERQAAVTRILARMAAPAREIESPYYPLKSGSSWVYKSAEGGQIIVRVVRRENVGESAYYLLETVLDSKVTSSERIAVYPDGVYRQSPFGALLQPHVRILPLPPHAGDSWAIKSRTAGGAEANGEGVLRVEDVTVPAGTFKETIAAEVKTQDANGESVKTVWYAKGVGPVKIRTKTKNRTFLLELEKTLAASDHTSRYLDYYGRGLNAFRERRYQDALPDLKKACESAEADAEAHDQLGMCYGKLGRWDEAIQAYTRSIEIDLKSDAAPGHVLNLLEALIAAERPEQLLQFIQTVEKKGWKLPKEGAQAAKYNALYHGFRAIALHMSGRDASDAERQMRQLTSKPGFKVTAWTWDELDRWLKTTKLAADRKAAVQKILAELKGTKN
jgi:tetratricopeptide (TPR) repeat protein